MKINRKFLAIKAHYFLLFAGIAPILPFLPVYARQLGISSSGVGLIYTVLPFIGLISKTLFGAIADWLRAHRIIFLSAIVVCAIGSISMYFTSALPLKKNPVKGKIEFDCSSPSLLRYCMNEEDCRQNNDFGSVNNKTMMSCELSCTAESKIVQSVCKDWLITDDSSCKDKSSLDFNAVIIPSYREKIKSCIYFLIESGSYDNQDIPGLMCEHLYEFKSCEIVCNNSNMMDFLGAPLEVPASSPEDLLHQHQFWVYFICIVIIWTGLAITITMSDTICFQLLGSASNRYGEQRMWGSIGWGIFVVISGALIDYASIGKAQKDYTPSFVLIVIVLFLDFLCASQLKVEGKEKGTMSAGAISRIMCEPRIVLFVLCCIVVGMSTGILWTFQLMLVEDVAFKWDCNFGAMKLLQGLIMGVQCFGGELPFFFLSGPILKKLGHVNAMTLVIGIYGIRYILYYTVSNPWCFLPIELLNGLTFGMFYATMTSYAHIVAPPGTEATMQGIVGAAFEGIGVAVGGFIGGQIFVSYGGAILFLVIGILNINFSLLHVILQCMLNKFWPLPPSDVSVDSSKGYVAPSESLRPVAASEEEEEENLNG